MDNAALTVRDVVALYLRHSKATGLHGPDALADRERVLGHFARDLGDTPVTDLKPFHLSDWIEQNPKWKSVSTRRTRASAVRACFHWAAESERIERNPFWKVRYAEAERRPELPDPVIERVASLANKAYERAVRFLRLTGCRLSELCRATWADVDLDRGVWTIPWHKSRKHTHRPKVVALVAEAVQLLQVVRNVVPAVQAGAAGRAEAAGNEREAAVAASGAIFLNNAGRPWNRRALAQQLRRMKARYGITEKATLHGIRHRMATAAIANGASLKLVSTQLGHSTTAITERYYVHIGPEHLDAIRQAAALGVPKEP
jgi:integrase